jgi:flavin reductase (DIM6/NTAB) family NADH-FMN oxidoreductase RutF
MKTDPAYELLREFASPVVAITSAWGGRTNGMISDSAVRASISPKVPRLAVQVHKWHLSHEFIWQSGLLRSTYYTAGSSTWCTDWDS